MKRTSRLLAGSLLGCLMLVCSVLGGSSAWAEPCESPRLHDLAPLANASSQDKVVAGVFTKTATTCAERGDACDQARVECGTLLNSIIQKQVGFDEGIWLRDMLLPYQGQQYPMSKVYGAAALAPDASCNVDVATLNAAAARRTAQATRRDQLFQEYGLYSKWAAAALQKCRERMTVEEQKSAAAKAESEKLAAAAAAATAADLAKKKAEDDAKKQAEEDARKDKEAKAAALTKAADDQKRQEAAVVRARADQLATEERQRAERIDLETRSKQERDRERKEFEEKSRVAEEGRALKDRAARTKAAKAQKEQLLADADAAYKRAVADEDTKKRAAVDAVAANPTVAAQAVADAAQATRTRTEAEKLLADARLKAERIEVDDSWERARGHVGILGGGGALSFSSASTAGGGGAMATVHFGFWGEAPLAGLAWGFEVALAARFFQPVAPLSKATEFEGHVTGRYFFGPLGIGAAGEFRYFDPTLRQRMFGVGPSLGIALVDTPHTRVIFSANWLPVGTAIDLTRVAGDLEVSVEWFTARLTGGAFGQGANAPLGWQAAAFVGVRFGW